MAKTHHSAAKLLVKLPALQQLQVCASAHTETSDPEPNALLSRSEPLDCNADSFEAGCGWFLHSWVR